MQSESQSTPGEAGGAVLARVGSATITAVDFEKRLDEQGPVLRARYGDLSKKKELLESMVRFEVMAQEARRRGLDKDPEIQASIEKLMVQKLVKTQVEDAAKGRASSEDQLRAYYDANLAEFVRPERRRVSHVLLKAPRGDARRAAVKAEATALLNVVRRKDSSRELGGAFGEAAKSRSDDLESRGVGGDLGFRTHSELTERFGKEVADAAFALDVTGDVAPLVEADGGFHLVKLTGKQLAFHQTLEDARERIASKLALETRSKAMEDFVTGLRASAKVTIDEGALEALDVASETSRHRTTSGD